MRSKSNTCIFTDPFSESNYVAESVWCSLKFTGLPWDKADLDHLAQTLAPAVNKPRTPTLPICTRICKAERKTKKNLEQGDNGVSNRNECLVMLRLTWTSWQRDADSLSPHILLLKKCSTCCNGLGMSGGSVSRLMNIFSAVSAQDSECSLVRYLPYGFRHGHSWL